MSDEIDQYEAAFAARAGADRMAIGLPSMPSPVRGDLDAVVELRRQLSVAVAAERERCARLAETLTRTARRWDRHGYCHSEQVVLSGPELAAAIRAGSERRQSDEFTAAKEKP